MKLWPYLYLAHRLSAVACLVGAVLFAWHLLLEPILASPAKETVATVMLTAAIFLLLCVFDFLKFRIQSGKWMLQKNKVPRQKGFESLMFDYFDVENFVTEEINRYFDLWTRHSDGNLRVLCSVPLRHLGFDITIDFTLSLAEIRPFAVIIICQPKDSVFAEKFLCFWIREALCSRRKTLTHAKIKITIVEASLLRGISSFAYR